MKKTEEVTIEVMCPGCGRKMKAGEPCAECGKKVSASDGLKVEYKDFKGAELLDIQMPGNRRPGPAKEQPEPLQHRAMSSRPAEPDKKKNPANKTVLILLAVVVIALTCYLLLRVFLSQ